MKIVVCFRLDHGTPPAYVKKFPLLAEGLKFLNFWGRQRPSDQFLNTLSGSPFLLQKGILKTAKWVDVGHQFLNFETAVLVNLTGDLQIA